MSLEVLKEIEKAEARADEIRAEAQREARDMLKALDEACVSQERAAALEHRALAQRILEDAQVTARKRIAALADEEARERASVCERARRKIPEAAERIFERVVSDGNR